jgi:DNA-binding NtrC family response regulator
MRVLVIDDDGILRRSLARTLSAYSLILCETAESALTFLGDRAMTFDAIVCDLWMPGFDGPTFYEALGELRPDLLGRVLFITGDSGTTKMKKFLADTGQPVLRKPFAPSALRDAVEQVATEAFADAASGCFPVVASRKTA